MDDAINELNDKENKITEPFPVLLIIISLQSIFISLFLLSQQQRWKRITQPKLTNSQLSFKEIMHTHNCLYTISQHIHNTVESRRFFTHGEMLKM